jgi:hypothetical protein
MNAVARRETLAGHRGNCTDYPRASGIGHARQPFTWLSTSDSEEANEVLASELQQFKRSREAVLFEAWALESESWSLLFSDRVRVIYVGVDRKDSKVRALLQWAPLAGSGQPPGAYPTHAV